MTAQISETAGKSKARRGVARWAGQMIAGLVIFGAILFLAAGRLDWAAGWAFLGMNALTQALSAIVLRPDLKAERSEIREGTKGWDRFFAPAIIIFGTLGVLVTAGLDSRFGWTSPFGDSLWILGLALAFCCQVFVLWAMATNRFFATTVRIQEDRDHRVVDRGPYRLVRHPGYLGSLLYNLCIPLALGSLWTYLPAALTILLLVMRTGLEDRTLQAELPGYKDYAAEVRFQLIPGIW